MSKGLTYLLPIAISFSRLIVFNELVVHELEREGGLAHTSRADHDDLVQRGLRRRLLRHAGRSHETRTLKQNAHIVKQIMFKLFRVFDHEW